MPSLKSSIGNNQHISLDDVCFLISISTVKDELGQDIETETQRQIFCSKLSITRSEFSAAGQLGYKPQILLVVDSDEYDQESRVKYGGKTYTIYKTFPRMDGYTELYSEVDIGGH
jgi:SPP1 family predicted phage head-tail adaptor